MTAKITDAQVERVLCGNPCSMDDAARQIIVRQGRLYTEQLISAAMESGFDLKAMPVVLMGGGAAIAKRNITQEDSLCRVLLLPGDTANAQGFEDILRQMSGGDGHA